MKQTLFTIAVLAAGSLAMAADPEPVYSISVSNGIVSSSGTGTGEGNNGKTVKGQFTGVTGQNYASVSNSNWVVELRDITSGPWTLTMVPILTSVTAKESTFMSVRTEYGSAYNFTLDASGNVGLNWKGGDTNDLGVDQTQLNGNVSLTLVSDAANGTATVYFVNLSSGSLILQKELTGLTTTNNSGFNGIQFMTALDNGKPGAAAGTMYVADFKVYNGKVVPVSPAVPEPATATLSLLALAGLCARRRRKAA